MKIIETISCERFVSPLTETHSFQVFSYETKPEGLVIYTIEQPHVHDIFKIQGERLAVQLVENHEVGQTTYYKSVAFRI